MVRGTILCFLTMLVLNINAQRISGSLQQFENADIELQGYVGFKTYTIKKAKISPMGNFELPYSKTDHGIGILTISGNNYKPFLVILNGEDIYLEDKSTQSPLTMKVVEGEENKIFEKYSIEHPKREQALSAWIYLKRIYTTDSLFKVQETPKQAISVETRRIKAEDSAFLAHLSEDSYIAWYLPVRKLVTSVSAIAQYRTTEIPATISAFRSIDYSDSRLYKSGLLKDVLESHFWLIENSGRSLDSVYAEMKISIDHLIDNLSTDEEKLNEITDYLFDLLERHSLFDASEYLALKVLNEVSCTIDTNLARQLETYRVMRVGNTAPDLELEVDIHYPKLWDREEPSHLSEVMDEYTVVVFGASWCPKCQDEMPQIAQHYSNWKSQGVEVVLVSLDTDPASFNDFVKDYPFLSVCDYKQWESPMAENYYVFGTPMMYLLDKNRKILLRPKSVVQMDAWVDWFLVQGNPIQIPGK